jgi:hypothetical protein
MATPSTPSVWAAHCRKAGEAKLDPVPVIGTGATAADAAWGGGESTTSTAVTGSMTSALKPETTSLRTRWRRCLTELMGA